MAFDIVINQAGAPAGVAGRAREDLATGTPVTLSISGGPFAAYKWNLVAKGLNIVSGAYSAAAFSAPTASTTQLSPIDIADTYLVEALVDSGSGLGAKDEDVERITFYAGPALASDVRRLPRRIPAFGERGEHNVPDLADPTGNKEAWPRELRRWFAVIKDNYLLAGARILYSGGNYSVVRNRNAPSAVAFGGGGCQVTFGTPLDDANYALSITPIRTTAGMIVIPYDAIPSAGGFTVLFRDLLGAAQTNASFSFRVELGP